MVTSEAQKRANRKWILNNPDNWREIERRNYHRTHVPILPTERRFKRIIGRLEAHLKRINEANEAPDVNKALLDRQRRFTENSIKLYKEIIDNFELVNIEVKKLPYGLRVEARNRYRAKILSTFTVQLEQLYLKG